MSGLAYTLVALVLALVLSVAFWLTQRKPKTFMSSIDEFRREMDALARDPYDPDSRRRPRPQGTRRGRLEPILPAPQHGDLARKLRAARQQGGPRLVDDGSGRVERVERVELLDGRARVPTGAPGGAGRDEVTALPFGGSWDGEDDVEVSHPDPVDRDRDEER